MSKKNKEKSLLYKNILNEMGYELLSEYVDSKTQIEVVCPNRHIRKGLYSSIKKYNCRECENEKKLSALISKIEDSGYTIIKYPDNAKSIIVAECDNGHIRKAKIHNFIRHKCTECNGKNNVRKDIEECRYIFENQGFVLLENEYVNCKTKMKYICNCGEIRYTTLDTVMHNKINSCNLCKGEKLSGKLHHNWNGGITDENVRLRNSKRGRKWRRDVFLRDNFTCQKCQCQGKELNAHHIKNFSTNEELRYELNNGITLCRDCHIDSPDSFHRIYGTKENTKEQLEEFLDKIILL